MSPWARGVQFLWHNGAEPRGQSWHTRSGELVKPSMSRNR